VNRLRTRRQRTKSRKSCPPDTGLNAKRLKIRLLWSSFQVSNQYGREKKRDLMRRLNRVCSLPVIAAISGTLALASCSQVDYSEFYEVADPVTRVVVHLDRGELELVGSSTELVSVRRDVSGWEGNLSLETRVVDDTLFITATCEGILRCEVNTVIELPADVEIEATVGLGGLQAVGLEGVADLSVNEGHLNAYQLQTSDLLVTVGVGSAELELLDEAGPASVAVGEGDLTLIGDPSGELDLMIASGGVHYL